MFAEMDSDDEPEGMEEMFSAMMGGGGGAGGPGGSEDDMMAAMMGMMGGMGEMGSMAMGSGPGLYHSFMQNPYMTGQLNMASHQAASLPNLPSSY